ncbi:MAG TPA: hypothetical protein PKU97_06285, partial [Kofleriaceae bacterium]|nr:hypothetical protein [Kofleriaceae bacterium]
LEAGELYRVTVAGRWAFVDAEQAGPRRLARLRLDPSLLPTVQRLTTVLLFGDPALRVSAAARAAAAPRQARLWGRGISGDEPIVLL